MKYSPGTPDDVEAAVAVWKAADAARRNHKSATPGGESRLRSYLGKSDSFLIVARDGRDVVGMAVGMQGIDVDGDGAEIPGLCHIGAVFVSPERWDEGIGRGLTEAVLSEAVNRNYTWAQLWTHTDNVRAQRLYEGLGFGRSSRTETDDHGETIVHYEREL